VKPDAGERLLLTRWANHAEGRTARGGRLFVTDRRLVFEPHAVERFLTRASRVDIRWTTVARVHVAPRTLRGLFGGGLRRRLAVTRQDGSCERFVVNRVESVARDLDRLRTGSGPRTSAT
jgi:hypothetical protein